MSSSSKVKYFSQLNHIERKLDSIMHHLDIMNQKVIGGLNIYVDYESYSPFQRQKMDELFKISSNYTNAIMSASLNTGDSVVLKDIYSSIYFEYQNLLDDYSDALQFRIVKIKINEIQKFTVALDEFYETVLKGNTWSNIYDD
jgi:hypothetical protein